jgi:hypothetical protein
VELDCQAEFQRSFGAHYGTSHLQALPAATPAVTYLQTPMLGPAQPIVQMYPGPVQTPLLGAQPLFHINGGFAPGGFAPGGHGGVFY